MSFVPVYSPTTAWPVACAQKDSVDLSYINRFDSWRNPETPKVKISVLSSVMTWRSYTMAVPQSGQKVTENWVSPMESFTISCQTRMLYG